MIGNYLSSIGEQDPANEYSVESTHFTALPTDHLAIGSGISLLTPEQQSATGLAEYYSDPSNFATLGAYVDGTYGDNYAGVGGTNWTDASSYGRSIFGTPWANEWDYSKLNPESLTKAFGTNANQIFSDARDWEMRDITRQNQQGSLAKTLAGYAGTALGAITGNPMIGAATGGLFGGATGGISGALTGAAGGYAAGGGSLGSIKNALGLGGDTAFVNPNALGISSSNLYNPASLGGAVAPSSGLGLTSANLFNPVSLGGTLAGPTSLSGGGYTPGEGFLNKDGLGLSGEDLYNPASLGGPSPDSLFDKMVDQVGPGDVLDMLGGSEPQGDGAGGPIGGDIGFGMGGVGAGSQPISMLDGAGNTQGGGFDQLIEGISGSAEQGPAGGNFPQYESQKLQPGQGQRTAGYQIDPFANAIQSQNALAQGQR